MGAVGKIALMAMCEGAEGKADANCELYDKQF